MSNPWIVHVKKYAKKHGISYRDAMREAKKTYKRGGNAKLAHGAYEAKAEIDGWKRIGGNKKTSIYQKKNEIIVAFRGTDPKDAEDLLDDADIVRGKLKESPRFKREKKLVLDLINKYGKENISLTGHSLGGSIARELSRELGVPAQVYNPGSSIKDFGRGLLDRAACKVNKNGKRCRKARLVTSHHVKTDPLAILGITGVNTKVRKAKKKNPHGIKNFLT